MQARRDHWAIGVDKGDRCPVGFRNMRSTLLVVIRGKQKNTSANCLPEAHSSCDAAAPRANGVLDEWEAFCEWEKDVGLL